MGCRNAYRAFFEESLKHPLNISGKHWLGEVVIHSCVVSTAAIMLGYGCRQSCNHRLVDALVATNLPNNVLPGLTIQM